MSSSSILSELKKSSTMNSKQLKLKTSDFLSNRKQRKILEEIIQIFEVSAKQINWI